MNLDDKYIYAFIRQNMFSDHQMAHSFHLGFLVRGLVEGLCQKRHVLSGHPNVIIIGEQSENDLRARQAELESLGVEHIGWIDPDSKPEHDDYGLTGIVTEPVTKQFKNKYFGKYKAWSERKNIHPFAGLRSASAEVALDSKPL